MSDDPATGGDLPRDRRRVLAAVAAGVALVVVAGVTGFVAGRNDGDTVAPPTPAPTASASPSATPSPTPTPTPTRTATPTPSTSPSPSATATTTPAPFGGQLAWPFVSTAEAAAWQASYRASGTQPWHLDAGETAVAFTTGFLGFAGIDEVVSSTVRGGDAEVSVGYVPEPGAAPAVAAVVHLLKIGTDRDAPWEVVGTRDSILSITSPSYGARVSSPIAVGGRITGVDESIRVQVREASGTRVLGEACCVPAGGQSMPWATDVSYTGATGPVLVIVASTGGHVRDVERFAVTAVKRS
jgi:hypothetical protein